MVVFYMQFLYAIDNDIFDGMDIKKYRIVTYKNVNYISYLIPLKNSNLYERINFFNNTDKLSCYFFYIKTFSGCAEIIKSIKRNNKINILING